MKQTPAGPHDAPAGSERPARRLRYEAPRIVFREKLEAVAAVCSPGKAFGQGGGCLQTVSS